VKAVVHEMRKLPSIRSAEMTFGPYDAIAIAEASDLGELGQLVASKIQPIPGVEQTLTCLAVEV
jgi:DNA-binding Lrp family transcriptional regulator